MDDQSTSDSVEVVSFEPVARLLREAAPHKAADLDALLARLAPACVLDRRADRLLFQAQLTPAAIRIGLKCTYRLEAHAYVAGIVIVGIGTPGYLDRSREQHEVLFEPADCLLNWAVARDLAPVLTARGMRVRPEDIFNGFGNEMPPQVFTRLNEQQRRLGYGLFRYAASFVLLHELAHLNYGHSYCEGFPSKLQERDADRFAGEWLLESASRSSNITRISGIRK